MEFYLNSNCIHEHVVLCLGLGFILGKQRGIPKRTFIVLSIVSMWWVMSVRVIYTKVVKGVMVSKKDYDEGKTMVRTTQLTAIGMYHILSCYITLYYITLR